MLGRDAVSKIFWMYDRKKGFSSFSLAVQRTQLLAMGGTYPDPLHCSQLPFRIHIVEQLAFSLDFLFYLLSLSCVYFPNVSALCSPSLLSCHLPLTSSRFLCALFSSSSHIVHSHCIHISSLSMLHSFLLF